MLPHLALGYSDRNSAGDSKLSHDSILRPSLLAPPSNVSHQSLCQFGIRSFYASLHSMLLDCISQVVGLCTKKQMIWVHARGIVAFVTDLQSFRNRSEGELPSHSVSETISFRSLLGWWSVEEPTVSEAGPLGCPIPTRWSPIDLAPESLFGCYFSDSHVTSMGSVVRGALSGCTLSRLVYFTATCPGGVPSIR